MMQSIDRVGSPHTTVESRVVVDDDSAVPSRMGILYEPAEREAIGVCTRAPVPVDRGHDVALGLRIRLSTLLLMLRRHAVGIVVAQTSVDRPQQLQRDRGWAGQVDDFVTMGFLLS